MPQLIDAFPLSPPVAAALNDGIGTINAARAVAAQRAYPTAFFDLHLQRHDTGLWTGTSPRYPEIEFVPD
ncbi:hypothetical protein ABGB12_12365 [Actinocorallia sp. B10E7]|uniref:hypothetical protein n=1 Tax=Actinocorallia sp. B10E7 TaxID=3153558 RepID=UPI00325C44D1